MIKNIIKNNVVDIVWTNVDKITPSTYEPDQAIATSLLGFPVYSNLQINNGQYKDVVTGEIHKYSGLRIDSAIMVVNGGKNLVETSIQGRNGTIKELIGNGDYQINISGFLLSQRINVAPIEEKNVLIRICQAQAPLEVVSQFLNDFGIFNIAIQNYSIQEDIGHRDRIPFTIQALSDLPYDIEIILEEEQQS
ncbi:DUF6046 domain-containing protein [Chryseolinea sp. T2]|uniref:DUF6046 domain-containing protein n=1 Tax=Chryseolinea sp. T2 TaxID=3129255 RepID=UPI003078A13B